MYTQDNAEIESEQSKPIQNFALEGILDRTKRKVNNLANFNKHHIGCSKHQVIEVLEHNNYSFGFQSSSLQTEVSPVLSLEQIHKLPSLQPSEQAKSNPYEQSLTQSPEFTAISSPALSAIPFPENSAIPSPELSAISSPVPCGNGVNTTSNHAVVNITNTAVNNSANTANPSSMTGHEDLNYSLVSWSFNQTDMHNFRADMQKMWSKSRGRGTTSTLELSQFVNESFQQALAAANDAYFLAGIFDDFDCEPTLPLLRFYYQTYQLKHESYTNTALLCYEPLMFNTLNSKQASCYIPNLSCNVQKLGTAYFEYGLRRYQSLLAHLTGNQNLENGLDLELSTVVSLQALKQATADVYPDLYRIAQNNDARADNLSFSAAPNAYADLTLSSCDWNLSGKNGISGESTGQGGQGQKGSMRVNRKLSQHVNFEGWTRLPYQATNVLSYQDQQLIAEAKESQKQRDKQLHMLLKQAQGSISGLTLLLSQHQSPLIECLLEQMLQRAYIKPQGNNTQRLAAAQMNLKLHGLPISSMRFFIPMTNVMMNSAFNSRLSQAELLLKDSLPKLLQLELTERLSYEVEQLGQQQIVIRNLYQNTLRNLGLPNAAQSKGSALFEASWTLQDIERLVGRELVQLSKLLPVRGLALENVDVAQTPQAHGSESFIEQERQYENELCKKHYTYKLRQAICLIQDLCNQFPEQMRTMETQAPLAFMLSERLRFMHKLHQTLEWFFSHVGASVVRLALSGDLSALCSCLVFMCRYLPQLPVQIAPDETPNSLELMLLKLFSPVSSPEVDSINEVTSSQLGLDALLSQQSLDTLSSEHSLGGLPSQQSLYAVASELSLEDSQYALQVELAHTRSLEHTADEVSSNSLSSEFLNNLQLATALGRNQIRPTLKAITLAKLSLEQMLPAVKTQEVHVQSTHSTSQQSQNHSTSQQSQKQTAHSTSQQSQTQTHTTSQQAQDKINQNRAGVKANLAAWEAWLQSSMAMQSFLYPETPLPLDVPFMSHLNFNQVSGAFKGQNLVQSLLDALQDYLGLRRLPYEPNYLNLSDNIESSLVQFLSLSESDLLNIATSIQKARNVHALSKNLKHVLPPQLIAHLSNQKRTHDVFSELVALQKLELSAKNLKQSQIIDFLWQRLQEFSIDKLNPMTLLMDYLEQTLDLKGCLWKERHTSQLLVSCLYLMNQVLKLSERSSDKQPSKMLGKWQILTSDLELSNQAAPNVYKAQANGNYHTRTKSEQLISDAVSSAVSKAISNAFSNASSDAVSNVVSSVSSDTVSNAVSSSVSNAVSNASSGLHGELNASSSLDLHMTVSSGSGLNTDLSSSSGLHTISSLAHGVKSKRNLLEKQDQASIGASTSKRSVQKTNELIVHLASDQHMMGVMIYMQRRMESRQIDVAVQSSVLQSFAKYAKAQLPNINIGYALLEFIQGMMGQLLPKNTVSWRSMILGHELKTLCWIQLQTVQLKLLNSHTYQLKNSRVKNISDSVVLSNVPTVLSRNSTVLSNAPTALSKNSAVLSNDLASLSSDATDLGSDSRVLCREATVSSGSTVSCESNVSRELSVSNRAALSCESTSSKRKDVLLRSGCTTDNAATANLEVGNLKEGNLKNGNISQPAEPSGVYTLLEQWMQSNASSKKHYAVLKEGHTKSQVKMHDVSNPVNIESKSDSVTSNTQSLSQLSSLKAQALTTQTQVPKAQPSKAQSFTEQTYAANGDLSTQQQPQLQYDEALERSNLEHKEKAMALKEKELVLDEKAVAHKEKATELKGKDIAPLVKESALGVNDIPLQTLFCTACEALSCIDSSPDVQLQQNVLNSLQRYLPEQEARLKEWLSVPTKLNANLHKAQYKASWADMAEKQLQHKDALYYPQGITNLSTVIAQPLAFSMLQTMVELYFRLLQLHGRQIQLTYVFDLQKNISERESLFKEINLLLKLNDLRQRYPQAIDFRYAVRLGRLNAALQMQGQDSNLQTVRLKNDEYYQQLLKMLKEQSDFSAAECALQDAAFGQIFEALNKGSSASALQLMHNLSSHYGEHLLQMHQVKSSFVLMYFADCEFSYLTTEQIGQNKLKLTLNFSLESTADKEQRLSRYFCEETDKRKKTQLDQPSFVLPVSQNLLKQQLPTFANRTAYHEIFDQKASYNELFREPQVPLKLCTEDFPNIRSMDEAMQVLQHYQWHNLNMLPPMERLRIHKNYRGGINIWLAKSVHQALCSLGSNLLRQGKDWHLPVHPMSLFPDFEVLLFTLMALETQQALFVSCPHCHQRQLMFNDNLFAKETEQSCRCCDTTLSKYGPYPVILNQEKSGRIWRPIAG